MAMNVQCRQDPGKLHLFSAALHLLIATVTRHIYRPGLFWMILAGISQRRS